MQDNKNQSHQILDSYSSDDTVSTPDASNNNDLQVKCDALTQELESQKHDFLMRIAEYENSRKRLMKDKEDALKYANEKLIAEFLPVLDSLEMTLSHTSPETQTNSVVAGVELIHKQLLQTLQKYGVEVVGVVGEAFDPHFHEAISATPSTDFASGQIIQVHRKGYCLKDRLIRAAMVTVSE